MLDAARVFSLTLLLVGMACASSGTAASRDAQANDPAPEAGATPGAAPTAARGNGPADFCCERGSGVTGQECEVIVSVQVQECMEQGKFELHCAGAYSYDGKTATCQA